MAKEGDIERAYARYITLLRIIDLELSRSRSNPTSKHYLDLGVITLGDKPTIAQKKIDEQLGEIRNLIQHLAVLDIAAAFEMAFRNKVTNSIGEARKAIKQQRKKASKNTGSPALVKNLEDMQGLAAIKKVLISNLSLEVQESMEKIRENRNNFAHGTDLHIPPMINAEETLSCLIDVFNSF